jgi:hypothetical protein
LVDFLHLLDEAVLGDLLVEDLVGEGAADAQQTGVFLQVEGEFAVLVGQLGDFGLQFGQALLGLVLDFALAVFQFIDCEFHIT